MRAWFYRFMAGRYGRDELGIVLLVASYVLLLASLLLRGTAATLLYLMGFIGLAYCLFRMFSRNAYKRRQENYRYLNIKNRVTGWFRKRIKRIRDSRTHRFFRCPGCGVDVRVPRGRGRLEITCTRCRKVFIRKS
jgi:hypothetical protein